MYAEVDAPDALGLVALGRSAGISEDREDGLRRGCVAHGLVALGRYAGIPELHEDGLRHGPHWTAVSEPAVRFAPETQCTRYDHVSLPATGLTPDTNLPQFDNVSMPAAGLPPDTNFLQFNPVPLPAAGLAPDTHLSTQHSLYAEVDARDPLGLVALGRSAGASEDREDGLRRGCSSTAVATVRRTSDTMTWCRASYQRRWPVRPPHSLGVVVPAGRIRELHVGRDHGLGAVGCSSCPSTHSSDGRREGPNLE